MKTGTQGGFSKIIFLLLTVSGGLFVYFGAVLAATSNSYQVNSGALVASDTTASSTSFQVHSRAKSEQVYGQSDGFQVYSSFGTDVSDDLVLATATPVNGTVATIESGFLNDNSSQKTSRDTKANHLDQVSELGNHIPMVAALENTDEFVITERRLDFLQATMEEPVMFFPVDRVSTDSRKNMIAIPGTLTMDQNPGFIGPLIKEALPSVTDFDEKYAIDLPTSTPVTFDGNIDICTYGTTSSMGVATADEVDVYSSSDYGVTWEEDLTATAKQFVVANDQFCFQTNHLTKFVLGQKTEPVVIPPTTPTTPSGGSSGSGSSGGSSGGGSGGGQFTSYNPQSILVGTPTTDTSFRIGETDPTGEEIFLLGDPDFNPILSFWERLTGQSKKSAEKVPEPLPVETPSPVEIETPPVITLPTESPTDRVIVEREFERQPVAITYDLTTSQELAVTSTGFVVDQSGRVVERVVTVINGKSVKDLQRVRGKQSAGVGEIMVKKPGSFAVTEGVLVVRLPAQRCLSPFASGSFDLEDTWYDDCYQNDKALFWLFWLLVLGGLYRLFHSVDSDKKVKKPRPFFITAPIKKQVTRFKNHAPTSKHWKENESVVVTYKFVSHPVKKLERE